MKKGVKKIIGGGILFVAGMILPFVFIVPLFFQNDDITFRVPGSSEISIEDPGRYYLWNNYSTVFEDRSYSFDKELPHGLSFSLIEKDSGSTILMKCDSSTSSESGNQKKISIGYYELANPGQYTLSVSGNTENRVFSFGKSFFGKGLLFFGGMILGMVLAFAAAICALVLVILGIIDLVRESDTANQKDKGGRPLVPIV
jgi:hypothetical protein